MSIKTFEDLATRMKQMRPVALAVAGGNDVKIIDGIRDALREGLIYKAIVSGDLKVMDALIDDELMQSIEVHHVDTPQECAAVSVAHIKAGRADVLMKGHIESSAYFRAILDKETGIRVSKVLSNVTVVEMPSYHKLLAVTDNAIVPQPDLDQKRTIVQNTAPLFAGLGVSPVLVAALSASEKISESMPATGDAASLRDDSANGALGDFVVDGPFGYDVGLSYEAARSKGLENSPVAGNPDLLLFANIEAANAITKAYKFHGQAKSGGVVLGAQVPVMLNSRSDSAERRINSLLLALVMATNDNKTAFEM